MLSWTHLWRLLLTSHSLQALAIGIVAAFLAGMLWSAAPTTFTALDWSAYDTWLRHRPPLGVSPSLTIVARDAASDEPLGQSVDRAVLAQIIAVAREGGAAAIGIDHRLDHASPAQRGGAASDTLLLESVQTHGPVVFTHDVERALPSDAVIVAHTAATLDPDHVARRIPLLTNIDGQIVPAFGSVLYDLYRQPTPAAERAVATTPVSSMLINPVAGGSLAALPAIPLSSVWEAIRRGDNRQLAEWFNGKVVVILPHQPAAGSWLLPTGESVTGIAAHVQLLNSLLTDRLIGQVGPMGRIGLPVLFASLIAWSLLRLRHSTGLCMAAGIIAAYVGLAVASLTALHLVLPLALPLTAGLFVVAGTVAWSHVTAAQRLALAERDMLRLQQEAAAVREALGLRETRVEALQEDLDVARETAVRSAGEREAWARTTAALRAELADVQAQEEHARSELERLERQLHALRASSVETTPVGDAELELLRAECRQLGIVTQDRALLRLFRDLKKGAHSSLTVLLLGEPGTGKELFARAVHRLGPRSSQPFIAVNMAAVSPELFESELFGHVRGSFTGATGDRRGYFELANHGTIFLDEIGDLRLDHQSKLLRVLQDKSFYRVGATTSTTVDVRIVAATNRDLQRGVSEGWFREDLYFRLTGLVFRLPPLRERTGDIPILTHCFLTDIARQMGKPAPKLSNEAMRALMEQEWKGNVRELRHCLEQAAALGDGPLLGKDSLRLKTDRPTDRAKGAHLLPDSAGDAAVLNCLRRHDFDMQTTAKTLGWDRSTVTQRLKGLCFQALVDCHGDQAKAAQAIAGDPGHLRTVELRLMDYYGHLLSVIEPFKTADDAIADCKRRFKNLPDRHFASVEALVRRRFEAKRERG